MPIVYVTGASTGIGNATALMLARAGHQVWAGMRDPSRGAELMDLATRESLKISISRCDVDNDVSVQQAFAEAFRASGRIDVLVNNAGIGTMGCVEETPLADFRAPMETNYFGALRCIQAVLPGMRERQDGCIINVTSVAGRIASASQGPYCASKWALEGLSESLAQEVKGFGVRVAIVEPGVVATPIFGKMELPRPDTHYTQHRRLQELFRASLENPTSPDVVATKISEIIETRTDKLRHPVGPDAEGFLGWRSSLSDEQWVAWGAMSDAEWVDYIRSNFGLNVSLQ